MKTTEQLDNYIISYINTRLIITGDNDDFILSCNIRHDLDVSYQAIAKILLKHKNIKKKIIRGSMHYIGVKYRQNN
jgi:hypothetical protein